MTAPKVLTREQFEAAQALVMRDYNAFIAKGSPEPHDDPKIFATWHTSARTALGHLEQLMKLHTNAGGEPSTEATALLAQAISALGEPEDEEGAVDGEA